jgi:hypothetical protein
VIIIGVIEVVTSLDLLLALNPLPRAQNILLHAFGVGHQNRVINATREQCRTLQISWLGTLTLGDFLWRRLIVMLIFTLIFVLF